MSRKFKGFFLDGLEDEEFLAGEGVFDPREESFVEDFLVGMAPTCGPKALDLAVASPREFWQNRM